ncbi:hypothetical protein VE04_07483 [Pseudogymnoascus sp. 24MN13]|nr:hypothetical protein VE04_07483 [Pseudogymnoascus sp. 24MN13]
MSTHAAATPTVTRGGRKKRGPSTIASELGPQVIATKESTSYGSSAAVVPMALNRVEEVDLRGALTGIVARRPSEPRPARGPPLVPFLRREPRPASVRRARWPETAPSRVPGASLLEPRGGRARRGQTVAPPAEEPALPRRTPTPPPPAFEELPATVPPAASRPAPIALAASSVTDLVVRARGFVISAYTNATVRLVLVSFLAAIMDMIIRGTSEGSAGRRPGCTRGRPGDPHAVHSARGRPPPQLLQRGRHAGCPASASSRRAEHLKAPARRRQERRAHPSLGEAPPGLPRGRRGPRQGPDPRRLLARLEDHDPRRQGSQAIQAWEARGFCARHRLGPIGTTSFAPMRPASRTWSHPTSSSLAPIFVAHLQTALASTSAEYNSALSKATQAVKSELSAQIAELPASVSAADIDADDDRAMQRVFLTSKIEALINSKLAESSTSSLSRVNYFSPSTGAVVNPILTSATYSPRGTFAPSNLITGILKMFSYPLPKIGTPVEALTKWDEHGDCWCGAPDDSGVQLGVLTPHKFSPEEFVIEHVLRTATLNPGATPRHFELFAHIPLKHQDYIAEVSAGLFPHAPEEKDLNYDWVRIGRGTYDTTGETVQVFPVQLELSRYGLSSREFVVRFRDNWGTKDDEDVGPTCIYRVRLHGFMEQF